MGTYSTPWTGRPVTGGDVPRESSRWAESRKAILERSPSCCVTLKRILLYPASPLPSGPEPQVLYWQRREIPVKRDQPRHARELSRGDHRGTRAAPVCCYCMWSRHGGAWDGSLKARGKHLTLSCVLNVRQISRNL